MPQIRSYYKNLLITIKQITVIVTDRGPFTKNREIDLSYAAADSIDMIPARRTKS